MRVLVNFLQLVAFPLRIGLVLIFKDKINSHVTLNKKNNAHIQLQTLQYRASAAQHEEHRVQATNVLRVDRLQWLVLSDLRQGAAVLPLKVRPAAEVVEPVQGQVHLVPLQLQRVVKDVDEVGLVHAQQFGVDWHVPKM